MTEKIVSFWEYCKLNFHKVMDGTRAECVLGKIEKPETEEYEINGVRYIVTKKFSTKENKTMKEKISAFIGSDFAHLTIADDINTLNTEYSIEGKGKNKTQRIVIHYRFIGVIENPIKEENIILEARQGVAVEYLTA